MIKIIKVLLAYLFFGLLLISCSSSVQLPEYTSALEAYNQGKYQTAITLINKAIEIEKYQSDFYVLRARANYKTGNKNLAMDDLNKSLELKNSFNALHLRGKLFLENNELEKAKKDFRASYDLNSESADLLFDLGYLEYMNGENQLALDYYTKAAKYDSKNPNTYVNIGNLYAMMGNSKLAIDNYSKVLVLDTTDGIAYYNRANEKMLLGNFAEAIEDYESSLLIDSTNINTLFILAEAKIKVNDIYGIFNNYNSIIKLDSTSAKAYYLRGTTEIILETNDKACLDFKKAGDLGYFDAYEMIKKFCDPKKKTPKKKYQKKSKR
jgi:tetratricopeptide (TPR) repeat protein